MPLIEMKEIMTPLKLLGIKLFTVKRAVYLYKDWNRPRKKSFINPAIRYKEEVPRPTGIRVETFYFVSSNIIHRKQNNAY